MAAAEKHRERKKGHDQCAADSDQMRPFSAEILRIWGGGNPRYDAVSCDGEQRAKISRTYIKCAIVQSAPLHRKNFLLHRMHPCTEKTFPH